MTTHSIPMSNPEFITIAIDKETSTVPDPTTMVYTGEVANKKKDYDATTTARYILGAIALGLGIFLAVIALNDPRRDGVQANANTTPTLAPTNKSCLAPPKPKIQITELCDIPDLDDDIFGDDQTMEIKILVNDQHYWPRGQGDCMEAYGTDGNACKIPDSSLIGCFPLQNPKELAIDESNVENIKVTIYDVDFFSDDLLDIFVTLENVCTRQEMEFKAKDNNKDARIKMIVDFGDVRDDNPCGINEEKLMEGLQDAADELEQMQLALQEYVKAPTQRRRRRQLIFGALVGGFRILAKGARSFAGLFTRSRASNALSTVADITQIATSIFGVDFGGNSNNNDSGGLSNQALLDKVMDRFDQIDTQLDNIEGQIKNGFDAIKLVVEQEFAEQELDEWITFRLGIKLGGDYKAYMDRRLTPSSRRRYEEVFRETCTGDYSPYNIFQVLYSHACLDCNRFSGKGKQYIMDTYVDLANANFEIVEDRVLWFRKTFGTVMIGALTEAIYFYSVCLYRAPDECQEFDPVWDARLEEMGYALEEVVESLGQAEDKLVN